LTERGEAGKGERRKFGGPIWQGSKKQLIPARAWPIRAGQWLVAAMAGAVFALARLFPWRASSHFGGRVAGFVGPKLSISKRARENLKLAFPEKSADDIEEIVRGVWRNLGRTVVEYPHMDRIWDYDPAKPEQFDRIEVSGIEQFNALKAAGKPALIFTAHLANWELLGVCAARYELPVAVIFRRPNNPYINRLIQRIRGENMGRLLPSGMGAALAANRVLSEGGQVGILVDQHFTRGPVLPFFGRPAHTAPTLAKLARRFDCPVHGAHVERLPGDRFKLTLSPPLPFQHTDSRDADIKANMAMVNDMVEGWVRENPDQWLWLHRRWRA
jgi:KDO2-lipid IV(A) lauroyltransferase